MTYEKKKKLIEAARVLQEWCNGRPCEGCVFGDSRNDCMLPQNAPCHWKIPTITRWTPEDVALAKALKAFGAIFLEKEKSGAITVHFNNGDLCEAPVLAFKCMPDGSYHVDNIIKEAEG